MLKALLLETCREDKVKYKEKIKVKALVVTRLWLIEKCQQGISAFSDINVNPPSMQVTKK